MAQRTPAATGHLGLGSNMGDRRANLQRAVALLAARGVRPIASSAVYETEPVGELPDQRAFLNAAIAIAGEPDPSELLATCKQVELDLGRDPAGPRHGPRPVDVDLLLLGSLVLEQPGLTIPHRDLLNRRFVLVPLLELDFDLIHPDGRRLSDALAALAPDEQAVRRDGPALALTA